MPKRELAQFASPVQADVHVNRPLTNLAIHYTVPEMVAGEVFPPIDVTNEIDIFYSNTNQEELISYNTLRAAGTPADEMEWHPETTTYRCEEHALKIPLPKRIVAIADAPTEIEKTSVKKLTNALLIAHERRVQALSQNAALSGSTNAAGTAWNAAAGAGTVEADISTAKQNVLLNAGAKPNAILMNYAVSQDVLQWLKLWGFTQFDQFTSVGELPPRLFDLDVIIGEGVYNASPAGIAAVMTVIWGRNVLVFHRNKAAGIGILNYGTTFTKDPMKTVSYWDNHLSSTFYEVNHVVDEVIVGAGAGCVITGT